MENINLTEGYSAEIKRMHQKLQRIMYQGNEAEIIAISPVLTLRIVGKSQVMCGNILYKEVTPQDGSNCCFEDAH